MASKSTSYTVTWSDAEGTSLTAVRARKDAAVKFGDALDTDYTVTTDSGKVVHSFSVSEPPAEVVEAAVAAEEAAQETFAEYEGLVEDVPEEGYAARDDAPAPGAVEIRRGRKWVLYFVDGVKVGALATDHFDALVEAIRVDTAS